MLKTSHTALGVGLAYALTPTAAAWLPFNLAPELLAGAFLGSILPDFDLKVGLTHRGVTHWAIWPALILWQIPQPFAFGLAIGWLAHLAADCLTVEGLRPLWPLPFHLRGFVRTGSFSETLTVMPLLGLIGWWIWQTSF